MTIDNVTLMEDARQSARQGCEDMTALYRDALQAWLRSGWAAMHATQAMGGQTMAFWHSRTKAGLETTRRLTECTSPQTLVEIQIDHTLTTVQGYADQIAKLRAITGRLVRDGSAPAVRSRELVATSAPGELAA